MCEIKGLIMDKIKIKLISQRNKIVDLHILGQ